MIVLDENLKDNRIRIAIAQWYQGQALFIRDLRPNTIIKDEAIPSLLQRVNEPTFVTINVSDFWIQTTPSSHFCIIAFEIPKERSLEIPRLLRYFAIRDVQNQSRTHGQSNPLDTDAHRVLRSESAHRRRSPRMTAFAPFAATARIWRRANFSLCTFHF